MKKYISLIVTCAIFTLFSSERSAFSAEKSVPIIRVCILDDQDNVGVYVKGKYTVTSFGSSKILWSGDTWERKIAVDKTGLIIDDKLADPSGIHINAQDGANIWVNNKGFRGNIDVVKKANQKLMVINHLPVESYLYGVLRHEVSHYWPVEVLKAQAIAARTFALYEARQRKLQPYDLRSDIYSQVYGGRDLEKWTTTKAVDLTKGQVLTYKGDIFPTYYHATCAGYTEDASKLWDMDLATLKGVPCNFCIRSPHYKWSKDIAPDVIASKLKEAGYKVGKVVSIGVLSRNRSRRVEKVEIKDNTGISYVLTGKKFRQMIGPNDIRSTNFYVAHRWGRFIIYGFGWGHGVGLCQWGAYGMAKSGRTAEAILKYYYPGSEITTIDKIANKL